MSPHPLEAWRDSEGIPPETLAPVIGVPLETLARIESGALIPSPEIAAAIARSSAGAVIIDAITGQTPGPEAAVLCYGARDAGQWRVVIQAGAGRLAMTPRSARDWAAILGDRAASGRGMRLDFSGEAIELDARAARMLAADLARYADVIETAGTPIAAVPERADA